MSNYGHCHDCPSRKRCSTVGSCAVHDRPVTTEEPTKCKHGVLHCGEPGYIWCASCSEERLKTSTVVDVKLRNPKGVAAKHKVCASLVPEIATIEMAQVFRLGATKYGPMNWRSEPVATSVYLDAIERHLLRYRAGEDIDPESGLSHLTHIMAGCAIVLDAELQETLIDDRMKMTDPSKVNALLEKYKARNEQA